MKSRSSPRVLYVSWQSLTTNLFLLSPTLLFSLHNQNHSSFIKVNKQILLLLFFRQQSSLFQPTPSHSINNVVYDNQGVDQVCEEEVCCRQSCQGWWWGGKEGRMWEAPLPQIILQSPPLNLNLIPTPFSHTLSLISNCSRRTRTSARMDCPSRRQRQPILLRWDGNGQDPVGRTWGNHPSATGSTKGRRGEETRLPEDGQGFPQEVQRWVAALNLPYNSSTQKKVFYL